MPQIHRAANNEEFTKLFDQWRQQDQQSSSAAPAAPSDVTKKTGWSIRAKSNGTAFWSPAHGQSWRSLSAGQKIVRGSGVNPVEGDSADKSRYMVGSMSTASDLPSAPPHQRTFNYPDQSYVSPEERTPLQVVMEMQDCGCFIEVERSSNGSTCGDSSASHGTAHRFVDHFPRTSAPKKEEKLIDFDSE